MTARIEGFVETLDETAGIDGWVVDHADPARALTVELWAGDTRLAATDTNRERPDVCKALGVTATPGFRFPDEAREMIRASAAAGHAADVTVRLADGAQLPGKTRALDLVRLADAPLTAETLADLLAAHQRTAARRLADPLPPLPDRQTGFLESLAADEHGRLWITGWIASDHILDRPAIILTDGKHAAGLALATVRRDDLQGNKTGFVGMMQSDWRPTGGVAPYLLMADTGARFLEPLLPTPVRSWEAVAPTIAHYLARSEGKYRDLLRDLFHVAPIWSLVDAAAHGERLQIDEVAILPGFGAFVTGWALSSRKDAEGFALKLGGTILTADPDSITRHDRPDVATLYPKLAHALETAGFVATFRGPIGDSNIDDVLLKVIWSDGSSTNDRATPGMIRILGLTAPIEAAQTYYPELQHERFFPDFAHHAATNARRHARSLRAYEVHQAPAVAIFGAPVMSTDLFLLYDTILRHAHALPADWGIAILAESGLTRPMLVSLVADIRAETGRAVSLFFTRRGAPSTDALDIILDALGADRFAWIDASVALAPAGWQAIAAAPESLTLLAATDPAAPANTPRTGLDAFVADRATWAALTTNAAPRIGGIALPEGTTHSTITEAATSLGNHVPPALIARINRALGHA